MIINDKPRKQKQHKNKPIIYNFPWNFKQRKNKKNIKSGQNKTNKETNEIS